MRFIVAEEVFSVLADACFGVVVARGIDNRAGRPEIREMLADSVKKVVAELGPAKIKEDARIVPYRQAFLQLGFNPNKFAPSVEALLGRVLKGGQVPSINNIVDLANAVSVKYILPIGAHDLDQAAGDIFVRFSVPGDTFVPFGSTEAEAPAPGELVYASGSEIKTRRWIWRQSEKGKITEESRHVFFPIDGFRTVNGAAVLAARDELAVAVRRFFNCEVKTGFVDRDNQSLALD